MVEHDDMTMADVGNAGGVMGPRGDRPKRRVFTAEFKAVILAEYEVAERAAGTGPARRGPVFLAHSSGPALVTLACRRVWVSGTTYLMPARMKL